jgi:CBS domain-containing protein
MHDIVEFLRRHAPFDDLPEEALEELARSVEVEFFPAGTTIIRQGESPMQHVRIVRRGTVELIDHGRVLDILGEGELFGHPSMLSGLPTGFEARAGEDTLCYRLPSDAVVVPLLARPAGLRYVARSLLHRPRPDPAAPGGTVDPARQPVARLVHGQPVICEPSSSVREAARRMADSEASAALVRLSDEKLGIVTDRDLRDRVVAGGVGPDAPVTEVMSAPAFTVTPEQSGAEVMLEMLDRDVRHVPVVWPHGEVLGVLSDRDLLAVEARAPFSLRRAIDEAGDVEGLRRAVRQLWPEVIVLHDAGVSPEQIASIISVVADALTRRLVDHTVRDLGAPPCPLTWLALGSHGRREVVPSSDIDSALVWDGDDDNAQQRYMQALGSRVVDEQVACGFTVDPHGATAAQPLFNRPLDAWRRAIRTSIDHPDRGKALVFISLLTDGRPVHGIGDARDPLDELRQARHRRSLLRLMLRLALSHSPPTGLGRFRSGRDLDVEGSGEHRGKLDIKSGGLLPIVGIARYASLAAGVRVTSTRERLDAAATAATLQGREARTLTEAHDFFWRLRLDHQVEQLREGAMPDDYIDVETLDPDTRRSVRDAFHAVRAVQRSLKGDLSLPP